MDPRQKAETVLKLATKYEKYVVEGLDDAEPSAHRSLLRRMADG